MTTHRSPRRAWTARSVAAPLAAVLVLGAAPSPRPLRAADAPPPAKPPAASDSASAAVVESSGSFASQGKAITVERFEPKAPGKYPGVVVLHGSAGMTIGGATFRDTARRLAREGYVAHVVHYFDLTGTVIADMATMRANFPAWGQVVHDAVTDLGARSNVDPKRVGVVGFSLGAYLALSLSVFDDRVNAVVDYFGGLPPEVVGEVQALPPTLILHGDRDLIVPVKEARALEALCRAKRVPHEVKVYEGQPHGFTGEAADDAALRTVGFLDAHLKRAVTRHAVARPNLEALRAQAAAAGR